MLRLGITRVTSLISIGRDSESIAGTVLSVV